MANKQAGQDHGLLWGVRAYLSGPMDFVAAREDEKKHGWRNRVSEFLQHFGVTVFDPWNKPAVRGLHEYGREDVDTTRTRELWTFEDSKEGARARASCSGKFWESLHIDLRMVDTSDFTIAYCPTNVYSVGTVHEIVVCRQQRKPVFLVSPRVMFPALDELRRHLKKDSKGNRLLKQMVAEIPSKENPRGIPSLWYMTLVGGERFFDGFGFANYRNEFAWKKTVLDDLEDTLELKRPLLPFLDKLNRELPRRWDNRLKKYTRDDELLLWNLQPTEGGGTQVSGAHNEQMTHQHRKRDGQGRPGKSARK